MNRPANPKRDPLTSWRFADRIQGSPHETFRLKGIPETPVEKHTIPGLDTCLFKLEYTCPTGSHKDRAAVFQVSIAQANGADGIVIPSSGNAAIAVAAAGSECGIPVYAFVSPETNKGKLTALATHNPGIILCQMPVNRARNTARRFGFPNLRPSTDINAVKGFMSLGYELGEAFKRYSFSSIFVFTTSGATLTGIARALMDMHSGGLIKSLPELHAVQSGNATGIALHFDRVIRTNPVNSATPGFGGLSTSNLYPELLDAIKTSGGQGWYVTDSDAERMSHVLLSRGIETSAEGCCALAAALRWRASGGKGTPMVVLTGKIYHDAMNNDIFKHCRVCYDNTYGGIERCIRQWRQS